MLTRLALRVTRATPPGSRVSDLESMAGPLRAQVRRAVTRFSAHSIAALERPLPATRAREPSPPARGSSRTQPQTHFGRIAPPPCESGDGTLEFWAALAASCWRLVGQRSRWFYIVRCEAISRASAVAQSQAGRRSLRSTASKFAPRPVIPFEHGGTAGSPGGPSLRLLQLAVGRAIQYRGRLAHPQRPRLQPIRNAPECQSLPAK